MALVTALDFRLFHLNSATAGFTYLLLILGVATRGQLVDAIVASFVSVVCYDYFFLPPILQFTIGVEEDWVALFGFLITAVTASELSARARRRADEASARRMEMEQVYEFSRALMIGDDQRGIAAQIAQSIAQVFRIPRWRCTIAPPTRSIVAAPLPACWSRSFATRPATNRPGPR